MARGWAAWLRTLSIAAVSTLWACGAAQAGSFERGLLWQAHAPDGASSHIFGTIHSEDPRVLDLPAPVRAAFDDADTLVMEMVPDAGALASASGAQVLGGDRDLESLLGSKLFRRATELMSRRGVPPLLARRLKPWVVAVTLSMPQPRTGRFLDMELYQRARRQGKAVHGLETASEQIAVFDDLKMQDQVRLLRATIERHDEIAPMLEALHEAYLDRDLAAMQSIQSEYMEGADPRLVRLVTGRMIDARNARMAERSAKHLESGDAFIAVGALHLPGEQGLLQRLADRGYRIERVY